MKSKYITIILTVIVIASIGCFAVPKLLHKHTYSETITAEATCETDGVKTYICTCGNSYTESIPATGHDNTYIYNDDATTEADGTETATCTICGLTADTRTVSGTKLEPEIVEKDLPTIVDTTTKEEYEASQQPQMSSSEAADAIVDEILKRWYEENGAGGSSEPVEQPDNFIPGNPETDMGDDVWDGPLDSTPDGNFIN